MQIKNIKRVRGTYDIFNTDIKYWNLFEKNIKNLCYIYNINEIRTPIIEHLDIFKKSLGELSDIVNKEMYTFCDKSNNEICLRPEGTLPTVRMLLTNKLLRNEQILKYWYLGPFFRYEKPQKGRYRQFTQFGVEIIGSKSHYIDSECILLTHDLFKNLNINNDSQLIINNIGDPESRIKYINDLREFLKKNINIDNSDLINKYICSNTIRIFDVKDIKIANLLKEAPKICNYINTQSRKHMNSLLDLLTKCNIKFSINNNLVRGLDYYTDTVFEWTNKFLGETKSICGGGRYDNLLSEYGKNNTPAFGFAIGVDRIIEILKCKSISLNNDNSLIIFTKSYFDEIFLLAKLIRNNFKNLKVEIYLKNDSFSKKLGYAKKNNFRFALLFDEKEYKTNTITIKDLNKFTQAQISLCKILEYIKTIIKE